MWQTPIYDRTQDDVKYAKNNQSIYDTELKGALDYRTLNRIESNIEYLSNRLNLYSYDNVTNIKTDWVINEYLYHTDISRILANLTIIREVYYILQGTPTTPVIDLNTPLYYNDINSIERITRDIKYLLDRMPFMFRQSGTFYSGESEGLI